MNLVMTKALSRSIGGWDKDVEFAGTIGLQQ
jgi:hypothetical protein